MPILRGFATVDETGRVQVPANLRRQMGLLPGQPFVVDVVRINGTRRWPRMFLHHRGTTPFISRQETVFVRGAGQIAPDGSLTLTDNIMENGRLTAGCLLEIKLMGAANAPWSVVHNRGVPRNTTLQERLGTRRRSGQRVKDWNSFVLAEAAEAVRDEPIKANRAAASGPKNVPGGPGSRRERAGKE